MFCGFTDAHLHMTDEIFGEGYSDVIKASRLFSCAATMSEWESLERLSAKNPSVIPFYGVHPWFVGSYEGTTELEVLLESNRKAGVGEIGLDGSKSDWDKQMKVFSEQIRSAEKYGRPAAVHMVKAEKQVLDVLSVHSVQAILHSFSGPENYVQKFADAGCYFSISPRILRMSCRKTEPLLKSIPADRLLIETDAPNCYKICESMSSFIQELAELMSAEPNDIIQHTSENAERLIP